MLVDRIRVLWLGFWSRLIGQGEARHRALVAQGAIEAHRRHQLSVREALTDLIFQRKKTQDRLDALDAERGELKHDVEDAARSDQDELALNLIARLESVEEEHRFLSGQVTALERDVAMARDTEKKLGQEIEQAERTLGTLASRHQALRARAQIVQPLARAGQALQHSAEALSQPLADQVRRLESELEALETRRADWEKDWDKLRDDRSRARQSRVLSRLKDDIKRRTVPIAVKVLTPETVS
jgi:phage shock protein A